MRTQKFEVQEDHRLSCTIRSTRGSQSSGPLAYPYSEILGLRIKDESLDCAADSIIFDACNSVKRKVFFVNAHCINVAARNEAYCSILHNAPFVYADGSGMAIAARLWGNGLENNVNGTDLFPILCEKVARENVPVALFGASPGIAKICAEHMEKMYPGLRVVWNHHGYVSREEQAGLIEGINRSGARILLVAKGVPLQELWIEENAPKLDVPVILGVGALFDFYSGTMQRAPLYIRKMGLEWLFRFLMEPRRLFRRYIIGNPQFLLRALKLKITETR